MYKPVCFVLPDAKTRSGLAGSRQGGRSRGDDGGENVKSERTKWRMGGPRVNHGPRPDEEAGDASEQEKDGEEEGEEDG